MINPISLVGTGLTGITVWNDFVIVPSMDSSWIETGVIAEDRLTNKHTYETGHGPIDVAFIGDMSCSQVLDLPTQQELPKVYPNPFNSAIRFENLGENIEIFDITGKLIAKTNDTWSPSVDVPAGLYLARSSQKKSDLLRIVYVK